MNEHPSGLTRQVKRTFVPVGISVSGGVGVGAR
jgi:hypothetical protein